MAKVLGFTFDWSYRLLDEASQRLLRRLSVFAGGWAPKEAVAPVCGEHGQTAEGLLALQHTLVRKSLIVSDLRAQQARYSLLETTRDFARQKLADSGEGEVTADRHAAFFLDLAKELEPAFRGASQTAALQRIERERDNLRMAQEWFAARDRGAAGLQRRSLELSKKIGYRRGIALASQHMAYALRDTRVPEKQEIDLYKDSIRQRIEQGDASGIASCLEDFARLAYRRGHAERAARLLGAADALHRRVHTVPERYAREDRDKLEAQARTFLGAHRYDEAFNIGGGLTQDNAVEEAMDAALPRAHPEGPPAGSSVAGANAGRPDPPPPERTGMAVRKSSEREA